MKKYAGLFFYGVVLLFVILLTGCTFEELPKQIDDAAVALGGWGSVGIVLTAALELLVRLVPTLNPWSFLLVLCEASHALGRFFEGLAKFLDGLGLQKLKEGKP